MLGPKLRAFSLSKEQISHTHLFRPHRIFKPTRTPHNNNSPIAHYIIIYLIGLTDQFTLVLVTEYFQPSPTINNTNRDGICASAPRIDFLVISKLRRAAPHSLFPIAISGRSLHLGSSSVAEIALLVPDFPLIGRALMIVTSVLGADVQAFVRCYRSSCITKVSPLANGWLEDSVMISSSSELLLYCTTA